MIEQLYEDIYDEQLAEGAIINDRMEGFKEDYLILHCLLRKYKIKSCFEIGCHTGFGTKIIKNALGEQGVVFSLDLPDEDHHLSKQHPLSEGKKGVGFECNLPFVLLRGDSTEFNYGKYPCESYWVDGEHTQVNVFCETVGVIFQKPKLIIYHDADMLEVYAGIIQAFEKNTDYDIYRITDTRIAYALKKDI